MEYSSSEFASIGNVTKKTLRHYDKIGLLSPSRIDDNGYWYFDEDAMNRLQIIRNLQVLGFSLREIKQNMESDFEQLRKVIAEKKRFVDEQILQLQLAKRLLKNVENKADLKVVDALAVSLEEEHIDWYKRNLSDEQYQILLGMMNKETASNDHERMVGYMKEFKKAFQKSNQAGMQKAIWQVKAIFLDHQMSEDTTCQLIEFFLKSNLEGPLTTRILSLKEVVMFLDMTHIPSSRNDK